MTTTEELVAQVNKILDDIGIDLGELFQDFDPRQVSPDSKPQPFPP
ncbi:hypothetical protein [Thermococcus sp. JCM 11816]